MLSIAERHKYILDSLNKHGFVRITDVANELGVTKVTIRKDIKILESKGLLYKVHGSARPANPHVADLDVHVKDNINRDAKRAHRPAGGGDGSARPTRSSWPPARPSTPSPRRSRCACGIT